MSNKEGQIKRQETRNGKVVCQYCGRAFWEITSSHINSRRCMGGNREIRAEFQDGLIPITYYEDRYPDAPTVSQKTHDLLSEKAETSLPEEARARGRSRARKRPQAELTERGARRIGRSSRRRMKERYREVTSQIHAAGLITVDELSKEVHRPKPTLTSALQDGRLVGQIFEIEGEDHHIWGTTVAAYEQAIEEGKMKASEKLLVRQIHEAGYLTAKELAKKVNRQYFTIVDALRDGRIEGRKFGHIWAGTEEAYHRAVQERRMEKKSRRKRSRPDRGSRRERRTK